MQMFVCSLYLCLRVCVFVRTYASLCVQCVFVFVCVYLCLCLFVCVYLCLGVCVCVCVCVVLSHTFPPMFSRLTSSRPGHRLDDVSAMRRHLVSKSARGPMVYASGDPRSETAGHSPKPDRSPHEVSPPPQPHPVAKITSGIWNLIGQIEWADVGFQVSLIPNQFDSKSVTFQISYIPNQLEYPSLQSVPQFKQSTV